MLGSKVYICDFHREQAWIRWMKSSRHDTLANDRDNILQMMRKVAHAMTEDDYATALRNL